MYVCVCACVSMQATPDVGQLHNKKWFKFKLFADVWRTVVILTVTFVIVDSYGWTRTVCWHCHAHFRRVCGACWRTAIAWRASRTRTAFHVDHVWRRCRWPATSWSTCRRQCFSDWPTCSLSTSATTSCAAWTPTCSPATRTCEYWRSPRTRLTRSRRTLSKDCGLSGRWRLATSRPSTSSSTPATCFVLSVASVAWTSTTVRASPRRWCGRRSAMRDLRTSRISVWSTVIWRRYRTTFRVAFRGWRRCACPVRGGTATARSCGSVTGCWSRRSTYAFSRCPTSAARRRGPCVIDRSSRLTTTSSSRRRGHLDLRRQPHPPRRRRRRRQRRRQNQTFRRHQHGSQTDLITGLPYLCFIMRMIIRTARRQGGNRALRARRPMSTRLILDRCRRWLRWTLVIRCPRRHRGTDLDTDHTNITASTARRKSSWAGSKFDWSSLRWRSARHSSSLCWSSRRSSRCGVEVAGRRPPSRRRRRRRRRCRPPRTTTTRWPTARPRRERSSSTRTRTACCCSALRPTRRRRWRPPPFRTTRRPTAVWSVRRTLMAPGRSATCCRRRAPATRRASTDGRTSN